MTRLQAVRAVVVLGLTLVLLVGSALPVFAQEDECPVWATLPAGWACGGFDLQINDCGDAHRVDRQFSDKNGNVVRTLSAGTGGSLTFTSLSTGKNLSTRSNGAVFHTTINSDGSQTTVTTGHVVIILFPSDVPAGPSTTLYVGKVVYTVDTNGTWTILKTSGKSLDICAALSD